jgi:hypothetical protein
MSEPQLLQYTVRPLVPVRTPRPWLRELPYITVLTFTIVGVAYTSATHRPLVGYWEFLALAMAVVCIATGWLKSQSKEARFRIVWTQTLHWMAFLVAMNIVLLPAVHRMLTAPSTGLSLLMLLALGTFVAGVHIFSLRICVLGVAMGLCVPAIAWLTQSALYLFLSAMALVGIGTTFWWHQSEDPASEKPTSEQLTLQSRGTD